MADCTWDIQSKTTDGKHYYDFCRNDHMIFRVCHPVIDCSDELLGYREFVKQASFGSYNFYNRDGDVISPQLEIYLDQDVFQLIFVANDVSIVLPRNDANELLIEKTFFTPKRSH